jgi:trigger factor
MAPTDTIITTVEPLDENKVKLHVVVPETVFDQALNAAFRKLAREVRIPGFRPGKAPRRLLEARFGADVARDTALRDSIPEYYSDAVIAENIDVIDAPQIDITAGEESGPVEFDAVVEVRPEVKINGYDALRVELENPAPTEAAIDAQIEGLRGRFSTLEDSDTPLVVGDYATIDITGSIDDEEVPGLTVTDYLYEVGSDVVVPELDTELIAAAPGDELTFPATLPERFGAEAGTDVEFVVVVKEAKKRILPELTNGWVAEASEFETIDELRADIAKRIELVAKVQASMALRDKVLIEAGDLVHVDIPEALVNQEMDRRLQDLAQRLSGQGLNITQYLEATGQDQQAFIDDMREGCRQAVRADLALRSVVEQEAIEATDSELDEEIARLAERVQQKPAKVRKDLDRRGVTEAVRSDIARGKALQFLIEHATPVDVDGNELDLALPEPAPLDSNSESEQSATEESQA